MTPEFEAALNQACADLCGPRRLETVGGNLKRWADPPKFATDRNALPLLLEAVKAQSVETMKAFMRLMLHWDRPTLLNCFAAFEIEQWQVCRYALMACNFWTPRLSELHLEHICALDAKGDANV